MSEPAQEHMERERKSLREISPERNIALAIGLAVLAACQPIEARPTDETPVPTPTPEFTPTPEEEPTPTVVKRGIETIQREIGGVQGTDFLVAYKDEIQEGIQFDLENGQRWFILGVYPDLPGFEETTHFEDEYILYTGSAGSPEEGERMVFLTARSSSKVKDALPFYWKEETVSGPNGNFFYIKEGRMVAVAEPFVTLEENEAKIVFNREAGRYEFLDKDGKVTREIRVFEVVKPAPGVEGLTYNSQERKYYAEAGNPYGLEVGEYAGMYYSNVWVQEKEGQEQLTGGVALRAEVVRKLIDKALAQIEAPRERFVVPIPVDISGLTNEDQQIVFSEAISKTVVGDIPVVVAEVPPGLPIVNILGYLGEERVDLYVSRTITNNDFLYYDYFRFADPYTDPIFPGLEMRYISVVTSFPPPTRQVLTGLRFGDRILINNSEHQTTAKRIGLPVSPEGDWNLKLGVGAAYDQRDMNLAHLLTVGNSPVFVIVNSS